LLTLPEQSDGEAAKGNQSCMPITFFDHSHPHMLATATFDQYLSRR
jgi:hypothetical protein